MDEFIKLEKGILINLEYLRKLNGYSLEEVGENIGISKSGYGKIEQGIIHISLKHLYNLSIIYEVPLDKIMFTNMVSYHQIN